MLSADIHVRIQYLIQEWPSPDERLKETQMTVINSEISPKKFIHNFVENSSNHSVLKRIPKRIVSSEPWANRTPETRDSSDTFGARTDETEGIPCVL